MTSMDMKTVSESQIIPVVIGDDTKTVEVAEQLRKLGFFVLPIRPPTVPPNTSRLRLSLTANMEFESVRTLLDYVRNEI
jgi:8-amino-7-oxononanoate synthase